MNHRSNSVLAVLERYGTRHFVELGRKGGLIGHGGRPRSLTLNQALSTRPGANNATIGYANMPMGQIRAAWCAEINRLEMGR